MNQPQPSSDYLWDASLRQALSALRDCLEEARHSDQPLDLLDRDVLMDDLRACYRILSNWPVTAERSAGQSSPPVSESDAGNRAVVAHVLPAQEMADREDESNLTQVNDTPVEAGDLEDGGILSQVNDTPVEAGYGAEVSILSQGNDTPVEAGDLEDGGILLQGNDTPVEAVDLEDGGILSQGNDTPVEAGQLPDLFAHEVTSDSLAQAVSHSNSPLATTGPIPEGDSPVVEQEVGEDVPSEASPAGGTFEWFVGDPPMEEADEKTQNEQTGSLQAAFEAMDTDEATSAGAARMTSGADSGEFVGDARPEPVSEPEGLVEGEMNWHQDAPLDTQDSFVDGPSGDWDNVVDAGNWENLEVPSDEPVGSQHEGEVAAPEDESEDRGKIQVTSEPKAPVTLDAGRQGEDTQAGPPQKTAWYTPSLFEETIEPLAGGSRDVESRVGESLAEASKGGEFKDVESQGESQVDESLAAASQGGQPLDVESRVGESTADASKDGESKDVESWGGESTADSTKNGESKDVESRGGESAADSTKNGESKDVESWGGESTADATKDGESREVESQVSESRGNSSHGGEFPSEVVEVAPPNIERREEREIFANSGEGFADSRIEAMLNLGKGGAGRLADARRRKVTDIKKALALNDKFLLMRAFFNNEPMRFTAELDRLNRAGSLAAAEQLLFHEILPGRKWDVDSEADNTLLTVLYRRYCD